MVALVKKSEDFRTFKVPDFFCVLFPQAMRKIILFIWTVNG